MQLFLRHADEVSNGSKRASPEGPARLPYPKPGPLAGGSFPLRPSPEKRERCARPVRLRPEEDRCRLVNLTSADRRRPRAENLVMGLDMVFPFICGRADHGLHVASQQLVSPGHNLSRRHAIKGSPSGLPPQRRTDAGYSSEKDVMTPVTGWKEERHGTGEISGFIQERTKDATGRNSARREAPPIVMPETVHGWNDEAILKRKSPRLCGRMPGIFARRLLLRYPGGLLGHVELAGLLRRLHHDWLRETALIYSRLMELRR